MKKKDENNQQEKKIVYPQFLSTAPQGVDLYDGGSQQRVMHAIEQYVLSVDNTSLVMSEHELPRIIGLEGKWGSGKSNVIKMLEEKSALKGNYIFFTYDAWGNQEDLQRKSILYKLTYDLIEKKVLAKNTEMLLYNPKEDTEPIKKECTWKQRLQSLTTHTEYTRNISIPSINDSTKWFGLALLSVGFFISFLQIFDNVAIGWAIFISLFPILVYAVGLAIFAKSPFVMALKEMFAMYETGAQTDTTSQVISREEPSIGEFKGWMSDLSKSLAPGKKLVIVFDNMDRLSTEKVRQLWSSIYTFFAGTSEEYENIWCLIPYDSDRLADVFMENGDKVELLKRFLQKTFPVIYRVPEPNILDYKEIVDKLLKKAFGNILTQETYDVINRCYRLTYTTPNAREIIAFINELVQTYYTWHNTIGVVSMAVYVLQKKNIVNQYNSNGQLDESADQYILDKKYEATYKRVLKSTDSDQLQRDIATLYYGIEEKYAYTTMLKRTLNGFLNGKGDVNALVPYLSDKNQISLIQEVIRDLDSGQYENACRFFMLDGIENLSQNAKDLLQEFWNILADDFMEQKDAVSEYVMYYQHIFAHISDDRRKSFADHFVKRLLKNKDISGANIFIELERLFTDSTTSEWTINEVCPSCTLEPKEFMNYVKQAKDKFNKYPVLTNVTELNEYLISLLHEEFNYIEEIILLKKEYDLTPFVKESINVLSKEEAKEDVVAGLLRIQQIYYDKFQNASLHKPYIQSLWNNVVGHPDSKSYPEIFALKALTCIEENLPDDAKHLAILEEKMLFYIDTMSLMKACITHPQKYLHKLGKNIILNKKHDSNPKDDQWEWVKDWQVAISNCGIQKADIIAFASEWGYQLSEKEQKAPIMGLLGQPDWVEVLLQDPISALANSLLEKLVTELKERPISDFIAVGTLNHTNSYWDKALSRLIYTDYIPNTENGKFKELVVTIIQYAAKNHKVDDPVWREVLEKCKNSAISSEIYDICTKILNASDGFVITPTNFARMHRYLEYAKINESRKSEAANFIISRVIDDVECQKIILANGNYYRPIIAEANERASDLKAKVVSITSADPDSEFSKFLLDIVEIEQNEENESEEQK